MRSNEGEEWHWGLTEELLAAILQHVDAGNRLLFNIHKRKGAPSPDPVVVRRPGRGDASRSDVKPSAASRQDYRQILMQGLS